MFFVLTNSLIINRSYFGGPACPSDATIVGKTVIITGGSSGIGLEVVAELLKRGGKIIVGARDIQSAEKEIEKIRKSKKISKDAICIVKKLDLSSLKSVRDFVSNLGKIEKKTSQKFSKSYKIFLCLNR